MNRFSLTSGMIIGMLLISSMLFMTTAFGASSLLSERTYKRLDRIHKLMDKENYTEAQSKLEKLQQSVKNRPYEKAMVMQTLGYLYSSINKSDKAIESFKACLNLKVMPEQASQNIRLNMTQLYMEIDKNSQALEMYKLWLKNESNASASAHILGGTLYANLKDYKNAIHHIKTALSISKKPREPWYQLLLAIYFETKNHTDAAVLLEKMVARFPEKKNYWLQLSGTYFTLKKDKQALSVSQLAYSKELLQTEKEIINLVRLYLYMSLPMQAATLLEQNITNNRIVENKDNLLLLSDSFLQARESESASEYLLKAAKLSNDTQLMLKLADIQANTDNWKAVIETLDTLNISKLKNPGKTHLLKGIAYYEQDKHADAIKSFRQASLDSNSRKNAQQWLKLVTQ